MRPEPQAVVRSTLPEAEAERSALVRTRLPGAVRSEVRGALRRSARTSGAGAAGQGERGEHDDERGAQRRGEEDTAVNVATPSNHATSVSFRHRR